MESFRDFLDKGSYGIGLAVDKAGGITSIRIKGTDIYITASRYAKTGPKAYVSFDEPHGGHIAAGYCHSLQPFRDEISKLAGVPFINEHGNLKRKRLLENSLRADVEDQSDWPRQFA